FSSRRRHTRWPRDWSSDVCSSDLQARRSLSGPRLGGVPGAADGRQARLKVMRVAAISDIHGNLPALEAVLAEVEREKPDLIVVRSEERRVGKECRWRWWTEP